MQSHALEKRGTIVSGIAWEPTPLPQQRICGCGRKIARISHSDICQRCIDREYEEKLSRSAGGLPATRREPRTPAQQLRDDQTRATAVLDSRLQRWRTGQTQKPARLV
jgi:hypothetical protein